MIGPLFVDTNLLVYRHDTADRVKQARAEDWYTFIWESRLGRLSYQVLQELYVTLTRKLEPPFDVAEAREVVRPLVAWQPVVIDLPLLERAWRVQERYLLSWWDALIVAAAQAGGCRALITEDLQHGQVFGDLRVIDPFASPQQKPAEVVAGGPALN